ncbi:hypothetical protein K3181_00910 [Qipengyuania sp. YG27]|uniref:Uncharacterized protein n=1 Tax=Qipengyuania mesophila TaxID=2867246 RepID=A0ABS7JQT2_9SPHN|nr:hypothetical protein [Qipengyuania mesophila]MBX7499999.1 hypothetical protein [Qipengyuania mesophila]
MSHRRKRPGKRKQANKSKGRTKTVRIWGREVPFRPKIGLFWLVIGFPLFFGFRILGQSASGDMENMNRYFWWAVAMTVIFALIGMFTKVLDD